MTRNLPLTACAIMLAACKGDGSSAPAVAMGPQINSCSATVQGALAPGVFANGAIGTSEFAGDATIEYNHNATPSGQKPSYFWIQCARTQMANPNAIAPPSLLLMLPYPVRVGTVAWPYALDSTHTLIAGYSTYDFSTTIAAANYTTLGTGAGGSVLITAVDPVTGEISGEFSFTGNFTSGQFDYQGPRQVIVLAGKLNRVRVAF